MQRFCTVVVGWLMAACGGPADTVLDVVVDPCEVAVVKPVGNISRGELESIQSAIKLWNQVYSTHLSIQSDAGENVVGAQHISIEFDEAAPLFYGVYNDEDGRVIVNRALNDPYERTITIAHELGHALGLWHIERADRISVMNPSNLAEKPNQSDANALLDLWGACPMAQPEASP